MAATDRGGAHAAVQGGGAAALTPGREPRSSAARTCWALSAAILLFAMIIAFVSPAAMDWTGSDFAAPTVAGVVLAQAVVFCLTCVFPVYKKGIWRGIFRQAVFFTGTATAAGCGAAIGLFGLEEEEFLVALGGILIGGAASLLVWFVPVPAYVPKARPPEDDGTQTRPRMARWLKIAGGCCFASGVVLLPILLLVVPSSEYDPVMPVVFGPLILTGLCLLISGLVVGRPRPEKPKVVELPVRRVIEIDSTDDLDSLLERHMSMYGYSLRNRSDLLWQFGRGDWLAQFWQSDIRRWKTDLTIAAYQRPEDGYRLNCHLDVDAGFSTPKQAQLRRLEMELDDLQELLGARGADEPNRGPTP